MKLKRFQLRLAVLSFVVGACPVQVAVVRADDVQAEGGFIVQPKLRQGQQTTEQSAQPLAPSVARLKVSKTAIQQPTAGALNATASKLAGPPHDSLWVPRGASLPAAVQDDVRPQVNATVIASEPVETIRPAPRITAIEGPPIQAVNVPETLAANPSEAAVGDATVAADAAVAQDSVEVSTRRERLAAQISSKILGEASPQETLQPLPLADAPPGWQAVGEKLTKHLRDCEQQLRHNAYFSAREEAEQASVYLMRTLDLLSNDYQAEPSWRSALQALRESEDFSLAQRISTDPNMLKRLIDSHETRLLQGIDTARVSPLVAAQHYRQYAEQLLVSASQGHPWASEIFYALGRTYQAQADANHNGSETMRWKAITFYRAAVAVSPRNAIAANQLGYVLLQLDRAGDARQALLVSLNSQGSSAALENLAEASRRLGDAATQRWAIEQHAAFVQQHPAQSAEPMVTELDPHTFIRISPRNIGPQPQSEYRPQSCHAASWLVSTPNTASAMNTRRIALILLANALCQLATTSFAAAQAVTLQVAPGGRSTSDGTPSLPAFQPLQPTEEPGELSLPPPLRGAEVGNIDRCNFSIHNLPDQPQVAKGRCQTCTVAVDCADHCNCEPKTWKDLSAYNFQPLAHGEYLGPIRLPATLDYRVRIGDRLRFVFILSREQLSDSFPLRVGDELQISSLTDDSIKIGDVVLGRGPAIQPDGTLTLPMIGPIPCQWQNHSAIATQP